MEQPSSLDKYIGQRAMVAPAVLFSMFHSGEQDVDARWGKRYPQLYRAGINSQFFNWSVLSVWLFYAIYQSLIIFSFAEGAGYGSQSNGMVLGHWDIGT